MRKLVIASLLAIPLAAAPVAAQRAAPVQSVAPPVSSSGSSGAALPSMTPGLEPKLQAPPIVPVQPRPMTEPIATTLPRSSALEAGFPPPGAAPAAPTVGYDPCLHPTSPPDYCKQNPK